jgi:hypothetical protein
MIVTTKQLFELAYGKYALGAYSGLKMPFKTLGQSWCFTVGGGYCSNPIMVIGLNFLSN